MAAEFKSRRVIYGISCCLKLTNKQSMRFQSTFLSSLGPLFILPNPPYPFIPDIFAC